MTSTIVPPVDLAPGMPSRVVTISATDVTEGGQSLEGQMVRFALSDTLDVSSGGDVIAKTQAEVVLDSNGEGRIRLPVYDENVKTWCGKDWAILVTATWGSQKAIRVPAGTSSIALSALPPVRPLRGRELQWAVTGVEVVVAAGPLGGSASLNGGILHLGLSLPPAGGPATRIPNDADLDSYVAPGDYYWMMPSVANSPITAGGLRVLASDPQHYIQQQAQSWNSLTPTLYVRSWTVSVGWGAWEALVFASDPRLSDARTPLPHEHDAEYYRRTAVDALIADAMTGATTYITAPAEYAAPVVVKRDSGGAFSTSVNPALEHVSNSGVTVYVDQANGVNVASAGGSPENAYATPAYAYSRHSGSLREMVINGGVFPRADVLTYLNAGVAIRAAEGTRVVFVVGDRIASWSSVGDNAYSGSIASCNGVIDASPYPTTGEGDDLVQVDSVEQVKATPGTFHYASGTVTVHLADGRAPDSDVYASRPVNSLTYGPGMTGVGATTYVEGIEWWGGSTANLTATADGQKFLAKNCAWRYSGTTNGLSILGVSRVVLEECVASGNRYDGFNYHENAGRNGEVVEIRCEGHNNGKVPGSQNGSTAHESYRITRVGGSYTGNVGANVADVNAARSWNVGTHAASSEAGIDFLGDDMWLDSCTSESATAAQINTTGSLRYRDFSYAGALGEGVVEY